MIAKPLDDITKEDIDALVANGVGEGRTLEYKEALPGGRDEDKRELLYDVSALANAGGGDIVFGIEEERDAEGKPTGRPKAVCGLGGANTGAQVLRLESLMQSGVERRIPGVRFKTVGGWDVGEVLILRIPRSWSSPHMVTLGGVSRFYSRNSAGKYRLDVGEIRAAFAFSEGFSERIRGTRVEQVARVVAGETPVQLLDGGKVILHLFPSSEATGEFLKTIPTSMNADLRPVYGQAHNTGRFNIDGYLVPGERGQDGSHAGYVQVFRDGRIEAVDAWMLGTHRPRKLIASVAVERHIIDAVAQYLHFQERMGFSPPIYIVPTLTGVLGFEMGVSERYIRWETTPIDRDVLVLPDVMVEDFQTDVARALQPAFDALWQAAGWDGSRSYDDGGNWVGQP